jgi:hypothetical protein
MRREERLLIGTRARVLRVLRGEVRIGGGFSGGRNHQVLDLLDRRDFTPRVPRSPAMNASASGPSKNLTTASPWSAVIGTPNTWSSITPLITTRTAAPAQMKVLAVGHRSSAFTLDVYAAVTADWQSAASERVSHYLEGLADSQ